MVRYAVMLLLSVLLALASPRLWAQDDVPSVVPMGVCPGVGIQPRLPGFEPGGNIITAWDPRDMWVYEIRRNARYPLPNTAPCGSHCHLSADAEWLTYHNVEQRAVGQMRLDGTWRSILVRGASEASWWSPDRLLVWTTSQQAYLLSLNDGSTESLEAPGLVSVQPGGYWGLQIVRDGDQFVRRALNLAADAPQEPVTLGQDLRYFNAAAWHPQGDALAYTVATTFNEDGQPLSGELFLWSPVTGTVQPLTALTAHYGYIRINGAATTGISWSPDGTRIAFWVTVLGGGSAATPDGTAQIHLLDLTDGSLRHYCDYSTPDHTPDPPRLVWSPDGTHLAFAGARPRPETGSALYALDLSSGIFTELSGDVYPALGRPDVVAWGVP